MHTSSIAFIGDLTVDKYPTLHKTHLGGASLNSAIWALRAGAERASVIAAVGNDDAGKLYFDKMHEEHIDSTGVMVLPGKTSAIEIFIDPKSGERKYGAWHAGVLEQYHLREKEYDFLRLHKAASLTVYGKTKHLLSELSLWSEAVKMKPFLVVNFDDLSQFDHSLNIVKNNLNGIDAGFFGLDKEEDKKRIQELRKLAKDTGKLMVVTLGKSGAIAFDGNTKYEAPARHINPAAIKDTTGAGDAFLAGFIVQYMKSYDILSSLVAGNRIAAQKIQILGAY
jgi:sugar/nucleoside kinase (ribokinase family)